MTAQHDQPVCVTGAAGYIGSHVVRELLERGYRVRGTVRNPSDEGKVGHLWKLTADARERLELVAADLMQAGSFDEAVAGCRWVMHVASAVFLHAKDPQREIVDPAVQGTKNILSAVEKAGTVERIGATSSIAAVLSNRPQSGHLFTEDDWCDDAQLKTSPYPLAKTLAERELWEFHDSRAADDRPSLTVVNPVFVVGPVLARVHLRSSPSFVRDIMRRKLPGCPPISFSLVDVRDVANALVNGVESSVTGRHILYNESLWVKQMAEIIGPAYPKLRVRTNRLPGLFMYAAVLFDPRVSLSYVRRSVGRQDAISNEKVQRDLGIELRPVRDSLLDTCASIIDNDWLHSKR